MSLRTLDIDVLATKADNIYETVVVLSKRARQISAKMKQDLDEKLAYYEGFSSDIENLRMQEEQARVSIEFEKQPKPTEIAIDELLNDEIYFRHPSEEG